MNKPDEQRLQDVITTLRNMTDATSLDDVVRPLSDTFGPLKEDEIETWLQHLMDLEYVIEEQVTALYTTHDGVTSLDTDIADRLIMEGLRQYIEEDTLLTEQDTPFEATTDVETHDSNVELPRVYENTMLLDRLEQFTGFDGPADEDISDDYDALPSYGETNVYSRALHFRLKMLGLYQDSVAAPRSQKTDEALLLLTTALNVADTPRSAYRLAGDIRALARAYIQRGSILHRTKPLVVPAQTGDHKTFDYAHLLVLDGQFVSNDQELRWYNMNHSPAPEEMAAIRNILAFQTEPSHRQHDHHNWFGQRMLQILLWMHGFYQGRIDIWWGPQSQQALESALSFEGIEPSDAIRYLENNFCAINLDYVIDHVFTVVETEGKNLRSFEDEILQEAEHFKEASETVPIDKGGVLKNIWSGIRGAFSGVLRVGRRIYRGAKSVVLSAVRSLRKGIKWITGAISDLFGPVLHFVRTVFTRIRDAIGMFLQAVPRVIHFILRRPIITCDHTGMVFSQFEIDADVKNILSATPSDDLVLRHTRICRTLARGAGIFLLIAATVLKTLADLSIVGIGWLRAGYRIGSLIREIIEMNRENKLDEWVLA